MLRLLLLPLLVLALACGARPREATAVPHGGLARCSVVDDPRCANPIDAVVLPELQRANIEPRPADRHELCRRLAIDLLGRAPTESERNRCVASSTEAIVDAWLASAEHAMTERRYWASLLDYDATYVWPVLVEDLDRLVGRLAAEEITYAQFAGRVVMHPAFFARHPDTDWLRAIFDIFLGRSARPDEVEELVALVEIWDAREIFDRQRGEAYFLEYGFSGCRCREVGGCKSAALGRMVDFGADCRRKGALLRMVEVSPGLDGSGRWRDADEHRPMRPLPRATAEQAERLGSLGDALAARLDFYEAAVDRELRRLLGWWQSSFNQPDTDLPYVRAALAEQLRETGSIRELQRTILSSVLYTMAATGAGSARAPVWSSGPRKLLPVEAWLDSAAAAVGHPLPRCDHRYVRSRPLAVYDEEEDPQGGPLDYLQSARSMGGSCRFSLVHRPSIGGLEAQRALAVRLCAEGSAVLPPDFDADDPVSGFAAASGHLVERILGRPSTPQERDVLAADMRACMDRPDRGCAEHEQAVRWTCVRLLTSAEFATY